MNAKIRRQLEARKRRIKQRLDKTRSGRELPVISASNIDYEISDRTRAISAGGIGLIHQMVKRLGLDQAINRALGIFKIYLPYAESDHVLNIAYNLLAGGTCLEHLELRRNDEVYLDALGARRIPGPTTAGDFCRRFTWWEINRLMDVFNETRLTVWRQQGPEFFEEAIVDAGGTMVETAGECKGGMDINYKGQWGYHPIIISLTNTAEPLFIVNRSGSRPSHEGASAYLDRAVELCHRAGFRKMTLRGDTDFTQTEYLDDWDETGVEFVFGIDAMPNLYELAENLPNEAWRELRRRPKYLVQTQPRSRPTNVKEKVVERREFENIRLVKEYVAEFEYSPQKCGKTYRVVVVWKDLEVQQKNGVHSLTAPVDNLVSNWAYMVISSLAWSLKAWSALLLPAQGRWQEKHKEEKRRLLTMDFSTFRNAWIHVPAQIIRTGRRLVYRFLSWNPWQSAFFRLLEALKQPLRC